ncbi:MAG TPA: universal stress protein [Myxococcaceae bacterium]|nr:universal stress protein [Myxococcaceae bacterium]
MRVHIRKLLVGFDESEPSRRALALASDIARQYGARIVLLSVLPPMPPVPLQLAPLSPGQREIERVRSSLEREASAMRAEGLDVDVQVEIGDPVTTLGDFADRLEIDVTVLGRSGKGAVARALLGSVTTGLLHSSSSPILIVP